MPQQSPSGKVSGPGGSWRRFAMVGVIAFLATGLLTVCGPRAAAVVAQRMATERMADCRFGAAQRWLAWSARFDPDDYRTDLLRAAWHRHLNHPREWQESLRQARRRHAPDQEVRLESRLGRIQSGGLEQPEETEIRELVAAGASPRDIVTAILQGYLVREDAGKAKDFLDDLPEDFREPAERDYLWGAYWRAQGNSAEAEIRLKRALEAEPEHELARGEIAALFEDQGQLDRALREYVELGIRSGGGRAGTLGLARVLRKLARVDEALAILAPLDREADPSPAVEAEMAQIELESGNCEEAERRLSRLRSDETIQEAIYSATLIVLGLRKKGSEAGRLADLVADRQARRRRMFDLRSRLTNNPRDLAAAKELQQLVEQWTPLSLAAVPSWEAGNPAGTPPATSAELYALHCAACHGAAGDGRGTASRHLFPRPRDLRGGRSQLAGTRNGVPTLEDLEKVLARGMPGTSMPKFDTLPQPDRTRLAEEVLRLRREGVREDAVRVMRREGEEIDEADVRRAMEVCTTAAEAVRVPQHWPDLVQAATRGRESYVALGCVKCHGEEGTGAADQWLFDDQGEPARPRDLVHEPFKGGREAESIYLRVAVGMPGTPHPAAGNVPEGQLTNLVQYLRSLAREPQRTFTNFERRDVADVREYLHRLYDPPGRDKPAWDGE